MTRQRRQRRLAFREHSNHSHSPNGCFSTYWPLVFDTFHQTALSPHQTRGHDEVTPAEHESCVSKRNSNCVSRSEFSVPSAINKLPWIASHLKTDCSYTRCSLAPFPLQYNDFVVSKARISVRLMAFIKTTRVMALISILTALTVNQSKNLWNFCSA